jgi:hypothetical protein
MAVVTGLNTFVNGTIADGTLVNENFNKILAQVNGELDAANVKNGTMTEDKLSFHLHDKSLASAALYTAAHGSDVTIDWSNGATQEVVIEETTHFILTNPVDGQVYRLIITQEATGGSHTATWHDTIRWAGGSAPTLTTAVNKSDIITFLYAGTTWYASATLNF